MLYDLNIAWSPSTSAAELERTLRFSKTLGYDVVALNHTINPPIPSQIVNPLPNFPSPSSTTTTTNENKQQLPTVLHRATLVLSDPNAAHRLPQLAGAYALVAVRPTTEREFQAACLGLGLADAPLISLDLTQRFPFHFRPKPCMAAVSRGARFEVCYAPCLDHPNPGADAARARSAFMGNVVELVRATRGRGIVLSSGARGALGIRAPADVVNLLAVWGGLGCERGLEGLGVLPRGVVVNEGIKRSGFRGVVDIVGVAEREGNENENENEKKEQQQQQQNKKQGQNKQGKVANNNNNNNNNKNNNGQNKRKMGQGSAAGGGGGGGDGGEGENQPMSKRQAKKMMKATIRKAPAVDEEKNA